MRFVQGLPLKGMGKKQTVVSKTARNKPIDGPFIKNCWNLSFPVFQNMRDVTFQPFDKYHR